MKRIGILVVFVLSINMIYAQQGDTLLVERGRSGKIEFARFNTNENCLNHDFHKINMISKIKNPANLENLIKIPVLTKKKCIFANHIKINKSLK